jgi:hypothetical protein
VSKGARLERQYTYRSQSLEIISSSSSNLAHNSVSKKPKMWSLLPRLSVMVISTLHNLNHKLNRLELRLSPPTLPPNPFSILQHTLTVCPVTPSHQPPHSLHNNNSNSKPSSNTPTTSNHPRHRSHLLDPNKLKLNNTTTTTPTKSLSHLPLLL